VLIFSLDLYIFVVFVKLLAWFLCQFNASWSQCLCYDFAIIFAYDSLPLLLFGCLNLDFLCCKQLEWFKSGNVHMWWFCAQNCLVIHIPILEINLQNHARMNILGYVLEWLHLCFVHFFSPCFAVIFTMCWISPLLSVSNHFILHSLPIFLPFYILSTNHLISCFIHNASIASFSFLS